jgi:hypothetical protein
MSSLAAYNARRHALATLEHTGWLNSRLNTIANLAKYAQSDPHAPRQIVTIARSIATKVRQYRRRHRFYRCQ